MSAILHTASGVVNNVGAQMQHTSRRVGTQLQLTTDRFVPPEQRREMLKRLHVFANQNPKLAAFLAAQIALTGLPLLLFLAFATTTLLVSVITCVLIGLLVALAFTFFVVGFALVFVVPTVFLASCSATFIFIWGFVGYVILRRLNEGQALDKRGTKVGDNLQKFTGGRADRLALWVSDGKGENGHGEIRTVDQPSAANGRGRSDGGMLSEGTARPVGGVNGTQEWEEKWRKGVKKEHELELEIQNPYDALKAEEPTS